MFGPFQLNQFPSFYFVHMKCEFGVNGRQVELNMATCPKLFKLDTHDSDGVTRYRALGNKLEK